MLVDFNVKNFRSIGESATLSMERIKLLREKGLDDLNIVKTEIADTQLLKSIALYGANASGKSNVIRSISYMKYLVMNSAKESQKGEPIAYDPFVFNPKHSTSPTEMEIRFTLDGHMYRYGFEVTQQEIEAEWCFQDEKQLFIRHGGTITCTKLFEEGIGVEKRTRENSLFLSVCAQWDGEISGRIIEGFFNKIHVLGNRGEGFSHFTASLLKNDGHRDPIITALRAADVGISNVVASEKNILDDLDKYPKEVLESLRTQLEKDGKNFEDVMISEISILHGDADKTLPLSEESDGTQKLFGLLGPVIDTIQKGEILIVDEFNDRLHPHLARMLVKMFHTKANTEAQLIFTTHDTNMLTKELFRRDQIWFTEKNKKLETDLYSLAEYRQQDGTKVRQDASYAKDYLKGRYGAVPYFGHFPFIEDGAD